MIVLNNLFCSFGSLPTAQVSAKPEVKSSEPDGFSAMYKRAAEASGIESPESVQGAQPKQNEQITGEAPQSENKLPEEPDVKIPEEVQDELPEAPEEETELPNELLALQAAVIPPIIQEQPTGEVPEGESDDILIPQITGEESPPVIEEDNTQVVLGLESNKDIDASKTQTEVKSQEPEFTLETKDAPEQTARMPQQTEMEEIPEQDATVKQEQAPVQTADDGAPCPLETENNTKQQQFEGSEEQTGRQDDKPQEKQTEDTRVFGQSQPVDISPERVIAADQLSQAAEAAPQTATVETLYDTLVESIFTQSTSESQFMEIQLKPEFLGKVAIQLSLGDSGLEIKIKAEDASVKGLISDQVTQLTSSLNDKGVKVTAIEVVYANVTDHSYDGSNHQRQDAQRAETAKSNLKVGFGIGFTEDENEVSVIDAGISSVEYRV